MGFLSKEKRNIYSATKSALLGLARASALDLGTHGITVNCIAPGSVPHRLAHVGTVGGGKESFRRSHRHRSLGRSARQLVGPALLLSSDAGSYITGQTIIVDGGFMAR